MQVTAFDVARRFLGTTEVPGPRVNPVILAMLRLEDGSIVDDATAWCSAFVNFVAWLLDLPRSKSLAARSWLRIGAPVAIADARVGFDVVVLQRGNAPQPGADMLDAPGHVGFFAGLDGDTVRVLGGNQGDAVTEARFPVARVLGVRRLWGEGDA